MFNAPRRVTSDRGSKSVVYEARNVPSSLQEACSGVTVEAILEDGTCVKAIKLNSDEVYEILLEALKVKLDGPVRLTLGEKANGTGRKSGFGNV